MMPAEVWLSLALSVSLAVAAVPSTKTFHQPGGATALVANTCSTKTQGLSDFYLLSRVLSGMMVLFVVAVLCIMPPRTGVIQKTNPGSGFKKKAL